MFPIKPASILFALFALSACNDLEQRERALTAASKAALESSCLTAPQGRCTFENAPIKLRPTPVKIAGRSVDFFPLDVPLYFDNAGDRRWQAPAGTLTDGASIPPLFVPLIGDPRTPEFALASALHDAYCGVGNDEGTVFHGDTWPAVHIMFHDALVASGTDPLRAKVMFAAVWIGGPRWNDQRRDLTGVSDDILLEAFALASTFLTEENPDLPTFVAFLDWLDRWMLQQRVLEQVRSPNRDPGQLQDDPTSPGNGTIGQ